MNLCAVCNRHWPSYTLFVRHMTREHGIDRDNLWRRIEQSDGNPVTAVRSVGGRWALFVQGSLHL
jgi:hypothetical protein